MTNSEIKRSPASPRRRSVRELLENREAVIMGRLMKVQTRVRSEIRRRVAAGETIPMDEILGASRTLGIIYSQHAVALRELDEYNQRHPV